MRYLVMTLILTLNGCTAYSVASTATLIATDKSLTDHVLTAIIPNSDCAIFNVFKGQYYCEIRDISQTYNRSGI